ncbi:gamma-aminobutyric acid receptor subunit pi-like [Exaiptasia diaphana]|uniref:Uncharacterized protein n=1 Tax=Exaiptasia diaphana TaxID=2652724 RepID=A0A913XVQ3_EXADI|nr:gamma-aminobutyric acid receptor subunit pi-like [Exaiptasia diaphana]
MVWIKSIIAAACIFYLHLQRASGAICVSNSSRSINDAIKCIKTGYDKVQRPNVTGGGALRIEVDVVVISVGSLDDINMQFSVEFYMRQKWMDPLLKYNASSLGPNMAYATLNHHLVKYLWLPDTYIENLKSLRIVFGESGPFINQGFRLYPNGTIHLSSSISSTLSCRMRFEDFPMDKQVCYITISSYFFTDSVLSYQWGELSNFKGILKTNQFDIIGIEKVRYLLNYSSGNYSTLRAAFKFRRRIQTFLLGFYIPSILTVMLSWVSFYISPHSAPARSALGIITVLAIGGFLTGQRSSFPIVSYVMAADLYILTCYIFAAMALLEYAVVHYLAVYESQTTTTKSEKSKEIGQTNDIDIDEDEYKPTINGSIEMKTINKTSTQPTDNNVISLPPSSSNEPEIRHENCVWKILKAFFTSPCRAFQMIKQDALIIDKISRVCFPLGFLVFNAIYWVYYKLEYDTNEI